MGEELNFNKIIKILKKKMWLIVFLIILGIVIAGGVSYYALTPIYQTSTQILVNQEERNPAQIGNLNVETNLQLINTYNDIIKSPLILNQVIRNLELDVTAEQLNGKINVNSESGSQVIGITVSGPDPALAVRTANMIADVFQIEIQNLMKVDNVTILSPAVLKDGQSPISPAPLINMAVAALLGLLLSIGLTFFLNFLDTAIKTEEDIEEHLRLPILGIVASYPEKDFQKEKGSNKTKNKELKELWP